MAHALFSWIAAQGVLWTIFPLILVLVAVSIGSISSVKIRFRDMVAERNAHVTGLVAARLDERIQTRTIALETILGSTGKSRTLERELANLEPLISLFD